MRWLVSLAAGLTALVVSAGAGAATCPTRYTDPVGDVSRGVSRMVGLPALADITAVDVSKSPKAVSFRVTFAKQLLPGEGVEVLIDTPPLREWPNPFSLDGADFYIALDGRWPAYAVDRRTEGHPSFWDVAVVEKGRTLSFSVARRKLGNPAWFDFVVLTRYTTLDGWTIYSGADTAPAAMRGMFYYDLRSCAPKVP